MRGKKGILLLVSAVVMTVVSVLAGVYLSSLVVEKRSSDTDRLAGQSLNLAEAGVNQAMAELRKRIGTDLRLKVEAIQNASTVNAYASNSLGFIRDYAYASGEPQFTVSGNKATLTITPVILNSDVDGDFEQTTITITSAAAPSMDLSNELFYFYYTYEIESKGRITRYTPALEKTVVLAPNDFTLVVRRDNFAKFALFTNHHTTGTGTTVWFTSNTNFSGPVHTNDRFSFASNPSASFTDAVSQHKNTARFYNDGHNILYLDDYCNGEIDVPQFSTPAGETFYRGESIINLESSLNQQDLEDEATAGQNLGSGVFVPLDASNNVVGGIYVNGSLGTSSDNPVITLGVDAGNNPQYTIVRDSNTYVVTVDLANNQTTFADPVNGTNTYPGIPNGAGDEGILIYVDDDIAGISGVVQSATRMTVASRRNVVIKDNITYQSYTASPLNADDYQNMLGIISWEGNVSIGTTAPDNVNIHAIIMAQHGIFTVDNYQSGSPRGTAILLGGVITDYYGPFGTFAGGSALSGYGRNFVYDPRVQNGTTPPYFPYMTSFTTFIEPTDALYKKTVWRQKEG
ncbi:MAG: DUF4900 domain-containing protein [Candidatus Omnitrophica bacterium]|jgi:Tfp pilus assembly protein PilX|nr:DUF4900 domain-containing protein [Candidatus Omnitrophota bacterium]MDD5080302.1 DUF4900 domain-containing protein [Candidatus Omnitrophota bacterium]